MEKNHLQDLVTLLTVQSKSRDTAQMRAYIRQVIHEMNDSGISIAEEHENLYITKGTAEIYPCIVAHTDTVHDICKGDVRVFITGSKLFAFDTTLMQQVGTGGDDKVGIFIGLRALAEYPAIKLAFFCDEEIGCQGSKKADMGFFDDVAFVLQADRKGSGEYVNSIFQTPLLSKKFEKALRSLAKRYKRKPVDGGMTDVYQLAEKDIAVSVMNMTCGYYRPHTKEEYIDIDEVEDTYQFVADIIDTMGHQKWPITRPKYTPPSTTVYKGGSTTTYYGGGRNSFKRPTTKSLADNGYWYNGVTGLWEYAGDKGEAKKHIDEALYRMNSGGDSSYRHKIDDGCSECGALLQTPQEREMNACVACLNKALIETATDEPETV